MADANAIPVPNELLGESLVAALRLADARSGLILLLSEDAATLTVAAAAGDGVHLLGHHNSVISSPAARALLTDLPVSIADIGLRANTGPGVTWAIRLGSLTVSLGLLVLTLRTADDQVEPESVHLLLRSLANQVSVIVKHARRYEDLRQKEQRLEHFVDKFLRHAEQRRTAVDLTETKLQELIAHAVRETNPANPRSGEPHPLLQRLTEREQKVLGYIVQGLTNKEIATQLSLSPDTVKNHVVHIMEKLGAQDRTQAAVFAIRQGLGWPATPGTRLEHLIARAGLTPRQREIVLHIRQGLSIEQIAESAGTTRDVAEAEIRRVMIKLGFGGAEGEPGAGAGVPVLPTPRGPRPVKPPLSTANAPQSTDDPSVE
jgi:DNA-binding NarL/FixJ family response regulator